MPSLKMSVPHNLSQEEAALRLKTYFENLRQKYQNEVSDLEESWVGDLLNFAFKAKGFNVKGNMQVEPSEVKIDGQLPFAAMMFKGKIEQTVRDQLQKVLA